MNRISGRAWLLFLLVLVLIFGLIVFCVRYEREAEDWVVFPGSPHLYSSGNLTLGTVADRSGRLLLDCSGNRTYSSDLALRRSVIHVLGDRYGYISAPLLSSYSKELIDFDLVNGLYDSSAAKRVSTLTLSADAQITAERLMEGRRGVVAVYNYLTGEILCLVSAPNYDPDHVPDIEGDETGAYEGAYVNRFYKSTYTPGSIFKVVTLSAALENIPDLSDMTFDCQGSCIIASEEIVCTGIHGKQTVGEAFSNSCNCAFAELSQILGREMLTEYAVSAGLLDEYDQEGITVKAGHFDLDGSTVGSLCWAGIGQYTDLINPCTYMTYMGMIANGASAARPYLMKEISSEEESLFVPETEFVSCGLKESTCDEIAERMRDNVVQIYGQYLFPDLRVCAKSGTAETSDEKEPNAMFAGFIDDENYPLAFIVVVEEGGFGSSTAAPIAGEVLNVCVNVLQNER